MLNQELIQAIKGKNIAKVQDLLDKGAETCVQDDQGVSALFLAIQTGQPAIVKLLLENTPITLAEQTNKKLQPIVGEDLNKIEKAVNQAEKKPAPEKKKEPEHLITQDEYIDEILKIGKEQNGMGSSLPDAVKMLTAWRKRVAKNVANLPFEQMMKKYNLTDAEWFCLCNIAYRTIGSSSTAKGRMIDYVVDSGILPASQLKSMFAPGSTLFKGDILECNRGGYVLGKEVFSALFGFPRDEESKAKDIKESKETSFPIDLPKQLQKYVKGQDSAVNALCAAVYEHYAKVQQGGLFDKNNIFLLGPTGTGKTYVCRTLARLLKVPFYSYDASQLTKTGYVGGSVSELIRGLRMQIKDMKDGKFPFSIVYIDEIDKISFSENSHADDVGYRAIQEEMLTLLESREYTCSPGHMRDMVTYDISNVLFIVSGAFEGLQNIINKRLGHQQIGFSAKESKQVTEDFSAVCTDDLREYGFMSEFLGRFGKPIVLNPLTEETLVEILSKAENSVLAQYLRLFTKAGVKLKVSPKVLQLLAKRTLSAKTGARGLKSELSHLLGPVLFQVKQSGRKSYTLTERMCEIKETI